MDVLPRDMILSHIDFTKNYTFEIQNVIQSMHQHSFQVTILIHIMFWVDPMNGPRIDERKIIKEKHFYILDDKEHDTLFVQHCFMMHWQLLTQQGIRSTQHWVWSDGCAGQFKASRAMYFVCRYLSFTNGFNMSWIFFGMGHGKGEWDGAGAIVKRALRTEQ